MMAMVRVMVMVRMGGEEEVMVMMGGGGSSPRNVSHDLTRDYDSVKTDQVSGNSALIHK